MKIMLSSLRYQNCLADGQTYQGAVANAETVIQEWIETAKDLGRSIPEPKGKLMYA
jgi:predicted RNase H-like HicB family nuclease